MAWFYASSVSVTNGSTVVSVNAGDDISIAQSAGGLIVGTQPAVEIKRTFLDGSSNKKIELTKPWPYGTQTNQPAVAFPTDGDLAAATAVLKQLIDGFTLATQAEAQAGTDNTKPMTALRVKQAMDALLGSASKLTATQNRFDNTYGRAFRVGDLGFGGSTITADDDNLDKVVVSGMFRQESPAHGIAYSSTLCMNSGDGRQQLTIGRSNYRMAFRGSPFGANGTGDSAQYWTPWAEVFHNYNAVGPVYYDVAKSVPTGAIIEHGSNASGFYTKFADGTMIAWHDRAGSLGMSPYAGVSGLFSGEFIWFYPAAFAYPPKVLGVGADQSRVGWSSSYNVDGNRAYLVYFSATSAVTSISAQMVAIGRWRA